MMKIVSEYLCIIVQKKKFYTFWSVDQSALTEYIS